jgi:hypothetical protein
METFNFFHVYLHCTKSSSLLFAVKAHNSNEFIFIIAPETLREQFTFHYLTHIPLKTESSERPNSFNCHSAGPQVLQLNAII